jgi:hypothetical protein
MQGIATIRRYLQNSFTKLYKIDLFSLEYNLQCLHFYRPDMVIDRLTLQGIQRVCESMPVKSMNLEEGNLGQDFHNDRLGI